MRLNTKQALDNILDCMNGSDGGVKFLLFLGSIRQLDEKATNGDKSAEEVINIIIHFSRMIDILSTRENNGQTKSNKKRDRKSKKRIS